MTGKVAIWKEVESRIPSIQDILYGFFKREDGSGSFFPKSDKLSDNRNERTLFMQKELQNGKDKEIRYIDPSIKVIKFVNENGSLSPSVEKKKLFVSWDGEMKCDETIDEVVCSPSGKTDGRVIAGSPKFSLRQQEPMKKFLKRLEQTRGKYDFDSSIPMWSEPKTNIRDVNVLALASGAAAAIGASFLGFFLPASALFVASAPMLIGAPLLANSEALLRNTHGSWFFNKQLDDDEWFSEIEMDPSNIKEINVKQDDEYYFHANVELKDPVSCILREESDVLTYYPRRRLTCNVR